MNPGLQNPEGWTLVTLKIHMDARCQALADALNAQGQAQHEAVLAAERAIKVALDAADRAVTKAEVAAEKRFESVNEFRGALTDQAALMVTRGECERAISNITDKIEGPAGVFHSVEILRAEISGRAAATALLTSKQQWSTGVILSTVIAFAALVLALLK